MSQDVHRWHDWRNHCKMRDDSRWWVRFVGTISEYNHPVFVMVIQIVVTGRVLDPAG